MHICVGKLTIIASDNGLPPGRRQAIIWCNAEILLIGPLGTNFNEILIKIYTFSFNKMHLKMSSAKWHPFCLGPNVLRPLSDLDHDLMVAKYETSSEKLITDKLHRGRVLPLSNGFVKSQSATRSQGTYGIYKVSTEFNDGQNTDQTLW